MAAKVSNTGCDPSGSSAPARPAWYRAISKFEQPDLKKAVWQLADTFVPYVFLWYLMIQTIRLGYPYVITLALAVPAAGLLVRIFILFHDCCHGSFLPSRRANTLLGYICGVLVFTPFEDWRYSHLRHHATVSNLDSRGVGDVWTMTVSEYRNAPRRTRTSYRLFRNPVILFVVGPLLYFLVGERFPSRSAGSKERRSVHVTNVAITAVVVTAAWSIGLRTYVLIQLPVLLLAGAAGTWLFYVQHQFEGAYWARKGQWDLMRAALQGSSFYKLPAVLQWFSGNIGLHFIHHVRPRIPNYNLELCYDSVPELQTIEPLTIRKSLGASRLKLWDEGIGKLVGFRALKSRRAK